ncbi:MAG: hypothetical protein QOJ14_37 [Thermoleophilaceae bacterium]|jgi:steroid delta-isomerase-like uncharacterized protein|nr:hypothetical protein [Thermoleophilaceae bacterium]
MGNEQNEAIARRGFDAFNTGDLSIVDEMTADNAVNHDPAQPDEAQGPEGFKQIVQMYRGAFPDLAFTIEECFSDGDLVCTRWTTTATHDGDLMGIPATGRAITGSGITIDRIQDGKVVESWNEWDNAGLMQQLGVGEPAAAAAS